VCGPAAPVRDRGIPTRSLHLPPPRPREPDSGLGMSEPGSARTQYFTATTLDGFIADPDNSLEWLFHRQRDEDAPLSYSRFITDVGALAMGATTYEWIIDHEFRDTDPTDWRWVYDVPSWGFTPRSLPLLPDAPVVFRSGGGAPPHAETAVAGGV